MKRPASTSLGHGRLPEMLQPPNLVGVVEGNLGILEQELGNFNRAREHYQAAQRLFFHTGEQLLAAHLLGYLGGLEYEQGNLPIAAAHYGDAITVLRSVGDRRLEGTFLGALGAIQAHRGRAAAARESLKQARVLAGSRGRRGAAAGLGAPSGSPGAEEEAKQEQQVASIGATAN